MLGSSFTSAMAYIADIGTPEITGVEFGPYWHSLHLLNPATHRLWVMSYLLAIVAGNVVIYICTANLKKAISDTCRFILTKLNSLQGSVIRYNK